MSTTLAPGQPTAGLAPLLVHHRPALAGAAGPARRGLLLHGLASSHTVWDQLLDRLPAGVETWTAELPWRADHVLPWSRQQQRTDWIAAALDQVPGGPEVVVAHSYSANLLLDFLSRQAAAGCDPLSRYGIGGIVLVSPFYRREADDFAWDAISGMQRDFLHIMEEGIRTHSGRPIDPEIRLHMARRVCERVGPYGWLRFFEVYLRTPWLRTELIGVPVVVVTGRQDFASAESERLAADLPRAELRVIPECGHYPMAERPELFSALVGGFLNQIPIRLPDAVRERA
ncbi:alpha/beta fold hydrolase [Streptomyces sp. NBC_01431]|uniref:alpha/beta fold hydrolase n=1 Tax=Streptomyces sp. NBC_01431 TaxID=2903863 RepID=UPI002E2FB860|nr:alpha/beta hydrolase [Streptomyces sp. NBC_01431]